MKKYRLHGRGRKECPVYSHSYDPANDKRTAKVFRPYSDRQVSAVHELNRNMQEANMERARRDAKIAILTQALATIARRSPESQHWAKTMLKLSDDAWLNVKPEDLVRAHVNMEWKGEDVPLYKDEK
jgi:hypothetical protein